MNIGDGVVFSWLSEDEAEDFASLHRKCFGGGASKTHLIDKSFGWRGARPFLAAQARDEDNRIIGAIALYPRRFSWNGRELFALEAADSMVAQEARGRAVFLRLIGFVFGELSADDCDFLYGFPNPAAQPGWRKAGVEQLFTVKRYYAPLAMGSFVSRKAPRLGCLKKGVDAAFTMLNEVRGRALADGALAIAPFDAPDLSGFESALACFERSYTADEARSRYRWAKPSGVGDRDYFIADVSFSGERVLRAVIRVEERRSAHVFELRATDPAMLSGGLSVLRRRAPSMLEELFGQPMEYLAIDVACAPERLTAAMCEAGFFVRETQGRVFFKLMKSEEVSGVVPERLFLQLADSDAI